MIVVYILVLIAVLGVAVYFICREYIKPKGKASLGSRGVLKNKQFIESMVANVESVIVYANGNDALCNRLVEAKDNIRFFNPTTNPKVQLVDSKLASRIDDLKIAASKDNTDETCFRLLEEIEAYIVQRRKEEQAL